jgi:protein TonB
MLHPFVSAPSASGNFAPVLVLSVSVHVGLLCLALTSTGVVRPVRLARAVVERVQFAELPFRASPSPARRSPARPRRARLVYAEPALTLPQLPTSFDLMLPEPVPLPDYQPAYAALEIGAGAVNADDVLHLGLGPSTSRGRAGALHNAYDEFAVEKCAVPVAANPKPRYPYRMSSRGIESNFNVYFVVDTTGTVDRATLELPPSVQQEFTSAVTEVLFKWRFLPAEMGGRRVRQRVLQPFIFRMEGQTHGQVSS